MNNFWSIDWDLRLGSLGFRDIDIAFAQLLRRLAPSDPPGVQLAALLTSRAAGEGHVCIDLHQQCADARREVAAWPEGVRRLTIDSWLAQLAASPVVDHTTGERPLVCDRRGRVYLQRLYQHEQDLAARLRHLAMARPPLPGEFRRDRLLALLSRYFPPPDPQGADDPLADWQKIAAALAVVQQLCIISGAPGTGKTTTVAKIIALLMEFTEQVAMRVSVCAPTGKAAARLGASLGEASQGLACPPPIATALASLDPCTIHRLLRFQSGGRGFFFNERHPLPTDLVVVDEASMVDLVLMSRLVRALPEDARLIILGDKDQLASVEAGAVFGDLCRNASTESFPRRIAAVVEAAHVPAPPGRSTTDETPLRDCIVVLRHNYRFDPLRGIGALTRAVNRGDVERVKHIFDQESGTDLRWEKMSSRAAFHKLLAAQVRKGYEIYLESDDPAQALERFASFRILCALAVGPFGVAHINSLALNHLRRARLMVGRGPWYRGRPVMITRNDYRLGLFNGDIGLVWPDEAGRPRVWFQGERDTLTAFSPQRLPEHETVFAMSVHKSQGSEFDNVLLVLPEQDAPVLTRELIYTGFSRARRRLVLAAREEIVDIALARKIRRISGLSDALEGQ
jgi:exodeoxyribonuclease V alpha subunit